MKKILFIISIATVLGGCSDFLEEYSQDLSRVETYTDLDEVLMGDGYLPMREVDEYQFVEGGRFFQNIHYMSDELSTFIPSNIGNSHLLEEMFGYHTWQQVVGRSYDGSTTYSEDGDWNQAYHSINVCNMVLDAIDEQKAENESQELEKSRIKGEAAFLRALYHFELVNLYGKPYCEANLSSPGIPVKLTPVVEDMDYTCSTVGEVYEQIMTDLDLADTCLANTPVKNHPYRADITAVYLLKSRVYLYMQEWEKALEYAQKTLEKNSGLLNLNTFPATEEVLSKSSPETIFSMGGYLVASEIHSSRRFYISYGHNYGWDNVPAYVISNDLINAYDEGSNDLRSQYYIARDTVGSDYDGVSYTVRWTYRKIHGWELEMKEVSDNFLFRTAEAYLNGAEAAAMSGDEATARTLLKTLRDNRMVESRAITESGEALADLIREERQRELCLEGHRWFDLRRYSVRNPYPYTKEITHYYTEYSAGWIAEPLQTYSYTLAENDEAYTLSLPAEVLDFQNTLGGNHRPARERSIYTPPADIEVSAPEVPPTEEYLEGYALGYEDGIAAGEIDVQTPGQYNGRTEYYDNVFHEEYEADQYQGYEDGFEQGYREKNPTEDYKTGYQEGFEAGAAAGTQDAATGGSDAYLNNKNNPYDDYWDEDLYLGYEEGYEAGYQSTNPTNA